MTSEEFAKWFVRPGGVYPMQVLDTAARELITNTLTLAKDYLALLERHKDFQIANDNLSRTVEERTSEIRTLRLFLKAAQPAPTEYVTEAISRELYRWLREI